MRDVKIRTQNSRTPILFIWKYHFWWGSRKICDLIEVEPVALNNKHANIDKKGNLEKKSKETKCFLQLRKIHWPIRKKKLTIKLYVILFTNIVCKQIIIRISFMQVFCEIYVIEAAKKPTKMNE